ncbi:hypothetical protein GSI_04444 [Ganoderma sinense ZZ0214-1]|uniref:Uncharacterized protein n=1 Tax=Ganoderma sinense ZZ0214-1 TaxID=1077348 RepID=A0A2G8SJ80_9APHY|nr:hypothetical protein GSI_04444 [Ganoderma sinense ZZ0214-1]
MYAEVGVVVWSTVVGVAVLIVLAIVLVARKKAHRRIRANSVQYVFTARVKTSAPGVTYLDFPAPPPPNHRHEDPGHGPTILRTFGRTSTKLRFSNKVEVNSIPDDTSPSALRQRRNGRPSTLQITPIANGPRTPETSLPGSSVPSHSPLPFLGVSRASASPSPLRRDSTPRPGPNPSHRELTAHSVGPRRNPTPGPSTSYRDPTPGPSNSDRDPTPGPSNARLDPTPGPIPSRRELTARSVSLHRDPTPGPSNPLRNPTPVPGTTLRENAETNRLPSSSDVTAGPSDPRALAGARASSVCSSIDITPRLMRHKRYSGKVGDGPDAVKVMMCWWETTSLERVQEPPNLSHREELRLGDLFLHRHDNGIQIWIWTQGREEQSRQWKKIPEGYVRADGRILAFTEVNKQPSWLDADWHSTRRKQHRL